MQFTDLIPLFIIAASTAYAVYFMLLVRYSGELGLFQSKTDHVLFEWYEDLDGVSVMPHKQPVQLQDRIRRLFGAYRIVENAWIVTPRSHVWQCVFCLSFWMAMPGTLVFVYLTLLPAILLPFIHLAHVCLSLILYHRMVNNVH